MPQVRVKVSDTRDNLIGRLTQQNPDLSDSLKNVEVAEVQAADGEKLSGWEFTHDIDAAGNKITALGNIPGHGELEFTVDLQRGDLKFTTIVDGAADLWLVLDLELQNLNRPG